MSITSNMYCLYDKVARSFMAPSLYGSDELAVRDLRFIVNNDPKLHAQASDFELILVGTFDSGSGVVDFREHVLICNLADLVERSE